MSPDKSFSRVLVVEDNPQLAAMLVAGLEQDDVRLETVTNGHEALAWIQQQRLDTILLDLGLPGLDGTEVLRQIKHDSSSAHIPVIVMTGRSGVEDKRQAFELGATDYVVKPFDLIELRARVHSVLRGKRLQDELSRANDLLKARTEFLAKTSHEIRTQLGAVTSMTGLLLQTELSSQQREYAETIFTCGDSLLTLLNDILNVSKIESGKMELEQRPFHLRLCLDEALDLLGARCAERKLDLLCDIEDGTPEDVVGDAARLRQVLFNLISNAVKFTHQGEITISVKARRTSEKLSPDPAPAPKVNGAPKWEFHFAVQDSGIGIPADKLGKLFQSFAQADSTISGTYGGTGLGLFISKGLVELMGGRMWAESREGVGSTFHFTVTLPAGPTSEIAAWQKPQPQLAGLRALVVDDCAASGHLLARQLQRWGMVPRTAESAWQALEWFRIDRNFDVILVDAYMPNMDGLALTREIRKLGSLQRIPVVLLAPVGTRIIATEMVEVGIHHQVTKPVKPAILHAAVARALGMEPRTNSSTSTPPKVNAAPLKPDGTLGSRYPLTILLTDDNAINQKVGSKMLNQLGYQPDIAADGAQALAAVQRQAYDVVFMDVQMPGMDGFESTRRIREFERQAGRPRALIVAMTAIAMQGDRERCLAAGMDDYLCKPVRSESLVKLLEERGRRGPSASPQGTPTAAPAPTAPAAGQPDIDMDRLRSVAGDTNEGMIELIDLYLRQTNDQILRMKASWEKQDKSEVARLAHTCCGASAVCGINSIVPFARELEHHCKNGSSEKAPATLDKINFEFERIRIFLLDLRKRCDLMQGI